MKRLLLVDDDAAFLKILSSLLQRDFPELLLCSFWLFRLSDVT